MKHCIFFLPFFLYSGIAAQLLGLSLLAIILPLCLSKNIYRVDTRWLKISLCLLLIWIIFPFSNIFHAYFNPLPSINTKKFFSSHIPSSMFISAIGILFVFLGKNKLKHKNINTESSIIKNFILGCFIASAIYFIYGVIQHIYGIHYKFPYILKDQDTLPNGRYRTFLFCGHPLSVASIALLVFTFFSYFYCYCSKLNLLKKKYLFLLIIIALLNFFILIMSGGRSATVVGLVMILLLILKNLQKKHIFLYLIFIISIIFILHTTGTLSRLYLSFLNIIDFDLLKNEPRFVFLKVHLKMFLDSPYFGHGFIQTKYYALNKYYNLLNLETYFRKYSAHNIFMQILVEIGTMGFLVVCFSLYKIYQQIKFILKNLSTKTNVFFNAFCFSFIANIFHGITQNTFFDSHLLSIYSIFFWILFWQISITKQLAS